MFQCCFWCLCYLPWRPLGKRPAEIGDYVLVVSRDIRGGTTHELCDSRSPVRKIDFRVGTMFNQLSGSFHFYAREICPYHPSHRQVPLGEAEQASRILHQDLVPDCWIRLPVKQLIEELASIACGIGYVWPVRTPNDSTLHGRNDLARYTIHGRGIARLADAVGSGELDPAATMLREP